MNARRFRSVAAGALCLASTGSCVQVLGIEEDRFVLPDTEEDRWSCLTTTPATTTNQQIEVFALDLLQAPSLDTVLDAPPVPNATISVCSPFDITCSAPMGQPATTDTAGRAKLTVPAAFEGYLRVESQDRFFSRFLYDDRMRTGTNSELVFAYLFNKPLWSMISPMVFQVPLNPDAGFVYAEVYDCQGNFAEGISFELQQTQNDTRGFYTVMGVPNPTLSETTGTRGGGFFNAPPGTYRLTARVRAENLVIAQPQITVQGGWDTTVFLGPKRPPAR